MPYRVMRAFLRGEQAGACPSSVAQVRGRPPNQMPHIEPLATPKPEPFARPNCGARYTLVRAEVRAEGDGRRCLASSYAVDVAVR
jgi:hypothetical protein